MFFRPISEEFNHYFIYMDWRFLSDYTLLTVKILIFKEKIQTRKYIIVKNSKEENNFVKKVMMLIKGLNIIYIHNKKILKALYKNSLTI